MKFSILYIILITIVSNNLYSVHSDLSEFKIYSLQGDTLYISEFTRFKSSKDLVIGVFLALPTCHQCCVDLDSSLLKIKKTLKKIKIIAIINSKPNIIDKRLSLIYFRKFFNNYLEYYFIYDSDNSAKNGSFKINNILIRGTPAIVLINDQNYLYLSYEKLFKSGFFKYTKLKKIINDFILDN